MKQLNRIISLFLISLSVVLCWASVRLGIGEFRDPGTGFMPFFTSSLLFFLAFGVLVKSFINKDERGEIEDLIAGGNFQKLVSLVFALLVYVFVLDVFGYLITTFVLISLTLYIFDPDFKKWWRYIFIGAVTAFLSFLIFSKWLQIQLPTSIFRIGF